MRSFPDVTATDLIGWASSVVLLLTIGKQVLKQWREGTSEGVSKWLFAGQLAASVGFTVYSWLVHDWVFVVTNALMLANAVAGLAIVLRDRRRRARGRGVAGQPGVRRAAPTPSATRRAPART